MAKVKFPDRPEPTPKNTLVFGEENPHYTFIFTHERVADLDEPSKAYFEEAVDRFASLLVENIEKLDVYKTLHDDHLMGIKNTIQRLKQANLDEDQISRTY
jgi:hypothetical protein